MLIEYESNMLTLNQFSFAGISPFTLSIKEGECIGITGDSGCGKTRLLRAIADLDEHEGELQLDKLSWDAVPAHEWRKKIALLPAESLWWFDTIDKHFPDKPPALDHQGSNRPDLIYSELSQLGFSQHTMSWESSRCSSGEKQRLSILRLLANKPRVLLLDEPTANLDPANTGLVEQLIADYVQNENAMVIWVSHKQSQLNRVSDRQFKIVDGEMILVEDSDLKEKSDV